jgi:hypothetical protein
MYMHISQAGTHRIRASIPNCIFPSRQTEVIRKPAPGGFELALGKPAGESMYTRSVGLAFCLTHSYFLLSSGPTAAVYLLWLNT